MLGERAVAAHRVDHRLALAVGQRGDDRRGGRVAALDHQADLARGEPHAAARRVDAEFLDQRGAHRVALVLQKHLPRGLVGGQRSARDTRAQLGGEHVGAAQHRGELAHLGELLRVARSGGHLVVMRHRVEPFAIGDARGLEDRDAALSMLANRVALRGRDGRDLRRQARLQLEHRQVHRQRGLEQRPPARLVPAQAPRGKLAGNGGVQRMSDAIWRATGAVLPHDLKDRQIGIAIDEREHRPGRRVERACEIDLHRGAQHRSHAVQRLVPQRRQLRHRRVAGLGAGPPQFVEVDQRAARQQGLQLLLARDELAAREQQGAVRVADVEGQRCAERDSLLDGGQRTKLHGRRPRSRLRGRRQLASDSWITGFSAHCART